MARERATVINSEQDVAELLAELLADMEFDVATYTDALPGIEELIASRPGLVIVNMDLATSREQLTGLQVIHSARTSSELRDVPIIVTTTDPIAIATAWPDLMERGDIHRIAMPFGIDTFVRVIEAALGRPHSGRILAHDADREGDG